MLTTNYKKLFTAGIDYTYTQSGSYYYSSPFIRPKWSENLIDVNGTARSTIYLTASSSSSYPDSTNMRNRAFAAKCKFVTFGDGGTVGRGSDNTDGHVVIVARYDSEDNPISETDYAPVGTSVYDYMVVTNSGDTITITFTNPATRTAELKVNRVGVYVRGMTTARDNNSWQNFMIAIFAFDTITLSPGESKSITLTRGQ